MIINLKGLPAGRQGFTLIELIVIIGMTTMIMVAVGGVITSSYKAKNNSDRSDLIQQQSTFVTTELKKNLLEANPDRIICPAGFGNSLSYVTKGGETTIINCDDVTGQIASVSGTGTTYQLIADGRIVAGNCSQFVSCDTLPSFEVTSVNFKINLGTSAMGTGVSTIEFMTRIAPRN